MAESNTAPLPKTKRVFALAFAIMLPVLAWSPSSAANNSVKDRHAFGYTGGSLFGDEAKLTWYWHPESGVSSNRKLWIRARRVGDTRWITITKNVAISKQSFSWDTSKLNPGEAAEYKLWLKLVGKMPRTFTRAANGDRIRWRQPKMRELWIDHAPPVVSIFSPRTKQQKHPVSGETYSRPALVAGWTYMSMSFQEFPTGVPSRRGRYIWRIDDGEAVTEVSDSWYFFEPGTYQLTGIAYDYVGNRSETEPITLIAIRDQV